MTTSDATPGGLVRSSLAVLGAGFAWFAYIDAPITDGAMLLFVAAVAAGFLAVCAALIAGERVGGKRAAQLLFLLALALMLSAATVTLNLRGSDAAGADTQTGVRMPA